MTNRLHGSALSASAFAKRLGLGVLLISLFVLALAGQSAYFGHRQHRRHVEAMTRNLAQVLENEIAGDIRTADTALFAVIDEYARQRAAGGVDGKALDAYILRLRTRLPDIEGIRITDAAGRARYGTGVDPAQAVSLADRPHFRRLRDDANAGLTISRAQVSRIGGRWVVALARRIDLPDGSFGGMAFATIALEDFTRKFAAIDVGAHGAIALRDAELNLVARYPEAPNVVPGEGAVAAELQRMLQTRPHAGLYVATAPADDTLRIHAYRQVADYPLYVVVGLSPEDYLAEWRDQVKTTASMAALCLAITLLAAFLIYLSWKHQRATLAFSETLTDSLPGVFFRFDVDGRLVDWNRTLDRLLGSEKLALAQRHVLNVVHDDDKQAVADGIRAGFEHGYAEVEARLHLVGGDFRYFVLTGRTLHLNHEDCLLGTGIDITERKRAELALREKTEALQRSNADLEQFAYSISHDMRQPLRMVTGHLQLLERALKDKLGDDDRANMAFALDGARRMDAMIVSLLDYSRVGRLTAAKDWMASRDALDEALRFLATDIEATAASVEVGGEWPRVFASRDEMTRLFQNLIGNALKYRDERQPPRVEVASAATAGHWRVSVRDHGIGIEPHQIERLFQFFSRLQSRERFEGTGMGLALCRKIVAHHDGRIWVESAGEGQGSSFVFEIPLAAASGGGGEPLPPGDAHGR